MMAFVECLECWNARMLMPECWNARNANINNGTPAHNKKMPLNTR